MTQGKYQVRAFAWDGRKVRFLAAPGMGVVFPNSVNDNDEVVGEFRPTRGEYCAIYYSQIDSKPVLLDSLLPMKSGWHLSTALGINDSDEIIGLGLYRGVRAAFLLKLPVKGVQI
jgi:hypothetical protein